MNRDYFTFNLNTGDQCNLRMTELNHNVVALQPNITLISKTIPNTCFQDIANFVIKQNLPYIHSIYFESVKFNYRFISFNLFGHVRAAFKKELKKPIPISKISSNQDNYNWIEPEFLPKFPDDIDEILNLADKKPNCLFIATKNGTINGVKYQLTNPKINHNYVYDLHPTDLIPVFDSFLNTNIVFPDDTPSNTQNEIINIIKNKYTLLNSNIKII